MQETSSITEQQPSTPSTAKRLPWVKISGALVLLLSLAIPYPAYADKTAFRPVTWGFPLWDWLYSNIMLGCALLTLILTAVICRVKKTQVCISGKTWVTLLITSVVWFVLANPYCGSMWHQFPLTLVFLLASWCFGAAFLRRFAYVAWVPILFISYLEYASGFTGILLSTENFMQVFATTWADAQLYLTSTNIAMIVAAIAVPVLLYVPVDRALKKCSFGALILHGSLFFSLFLVAVRPLETHLQVGARYIWPIGVFTKVGSTAGMAGVSLHRINAFLSQLPKEEEVTIQGAEVPQDSGIICFLHVGESLRADHCSFNGYERETCPNLQQEPGLINFADCVSAAPGTDRAMLAILTDCRRNFLDSKGKKALTSGGIMDYFSRAHFRCLSYWGPGTFSEQNTLIGKQAAFFCRMAEKNVVVPGNSAEQLPVIKAALDTPASNRNVFVLINNRGSHAFFEDFNQKNPPFTPTQLLTPNDSPKPGSEPKMKEVFINTYDNTVHHTDAYIHDLLCHYKGKPYVYIYVSDHGEYLGKEGYWMRGNAPHEVYYKGNACQVPFFVVASPEFEALHPHFKEALTQLRAHTGMSTAHEHVFHTILGLFGIHTSVYNKELDLCSPQVKPYTGPHPDRGGKPTQGDNPVLK